MKWKLQSVERFDPLVPPVFLIYQSGKETRLPIVGRIERNPSMLEISEKIGGVLWHGEVLWSSGCLRVESCAHYETTKSIISSPRRRRGERSRQLTNAVLSYFSARRLCKCNHIVSHDEIILDNGVPLESCTYLRIGFNKKICISAEWAWITRVSLCFPRYAQYVYIYIRTLETLISMPNENERISNLSLSVYRNSR